MTPSTTPAPAPAGVGLPRSRAVVVMAVVALVLIGLNLRAGITSASTLLHDLQLALGYGPLVASVIPSIPTLCFAVAGAATSWLTGKLGVEKAIVLALALLAGGLLLRGVAATGTLVGGTVVGMCGLAVCNVAMPSFIREHFASRTSLMTGVYTLTMTTGATAASILAVPMAQALGSASAAVGSVGFLAAAALLGFLPLALHSHRHGVRTGEPRIRPWPLLRTRKGLLITAVFTLQSLLAYSVLSWFPYQLITKGMDAAESGLMYGLLQLVSVPAGMLLIALGSRPGMLRPAFYLAGLGMASGLLCQLLLPVELAIVPACLTGLGIGIFPLVMVLISRSGKTTAETTALSTLAQSVGYLLATMGPFGVGLLQGATGNWTLPLSILLALAVTQIVMGHLLTSSAGTPGAAGRRR